MRNDIQTFDQLSEAFLQDLRKRMNKNKLKVKLESIIIKIEKTLISTPIIKEITAIHRVLTGRDRNIAFRISRDSMIENTAIGYIHDMIQNQMLKQLIQEYANQNNLPTAYCLKRYDELLKELKIFNLSRLCPNTSNLIDRINSELKQNKRFIETENNTIIQNLVINYKQLVEARARINIFFINLRYAKHSNNSNLENERPWETHTAPSLHGYQKIHTHRKHCHLHHE